MMINCPLCGSKSTIMTSEKMSELVRVAYCQCRNLECSTSFKVMVEAVALIEKKTENSKSNLEVVRMVR